MKTRIHFLDNLRTFMILLVVVLHTAIGYTSFLENIWIVNDTEKSDALGYLVMYIDLFVMFILFFISGYFIPRSYKNRNLIQFMISKFKRIMIPWILAVFTLIPACKYIFLYSRGLPQEEWYTYFHFFTRTDGNMGFLADNPTQSWLWFLPVLFLFQVTYALLARTPVLKIRISLSTAVSTVFTVALIYSLTIATMELNGWFSSHLLHFQRERLLSYFLFFLLGSLCYKMNAFETFKKRYLLTISSGTIMALSIYIFTILTGNYIENLIAPGRNIFIVSEAADGILYYASVYMVALSSLYILIYLFRIIMNRTGSLLGEFSANSYQVYIIHIIVIGLVSLPVINFTAPAILKFVIVSILSVAASNAIVSVYRHTVQRTLSRNIITYPAVAMILLFAGFAYGQNGTSSHTDIPQDQMDAPEISIHLAAIYGDTTAIRQHIIVGTDVNEKEPSGASTPLISASLFGKDDAVKMLIEAGADINYQNNDGSTALHTAAFLCHPEIVQMLLDHGADREIRNNPGSTALESVLAPWEVVKGIYDYFGNTLGPLGLEIDYEYLKETRPKIAAILKN
jgi:fucose 4-O-acetylase-like acetyltransferase